ncbi:MAG: trans-aconitate 2-methyltransferase [Novosphingobium sp.]
MTDMREWQGQVGNAWARSWRQTDRAMSGITALLLQLIDRLPGKEVADIGCGAGELSLAIARQRGDARVTGIDVSPDLIAAARMRGSDQPRVTFELADASHWQPERVPDLLVSRHGVMFFADPPAAFAHLHAVSAKGAQLAFSCFRDASLNRWASEPAEAVGGMVAPPEGPMPGPFAFADPDHVHAVLSEGGWSGIQCEPHDTAFVIGQGEDALDQGVDFFSRIGPTAPRFAELEGNAKAQAVGRLRDLLRSRLHEGLLAYSAAIWLVTAWRD